MIDPYKLHIAQRAHELGFRFDESEIIDVIDGDHRYIFLRSIKATRQVAQPDGAITDEEFNDPIIWLDMPSPLLARCDVDQGRQVLNYTFYQPQLRILYPELISVLPCLVRE